MKKSKFLFSSLIKMGLAIGDWTKVEVDESSLDPLNVSNIQYNNFDGLSKDIIKKLNYFHYLFACSIAKYYSETLDLSIENHTVMVTQLSYEDFMDSLKKDIYQMEINIPEAGSARLLVGKSFASMILDRMLGGAGDNKETENFSTIEKQLLYSELKQMLPFFKNIWNDSFTEQSLDTQMLSEFQWDNRISKRETVLIFTLYMYFGESELMRVMLAYPSSVVRNLYAASMAVNKTITEKICLETHTLKKSQYNVCVELGKTYLSMPEIIGLSSGDILPLNTKLGDSVAMKIADKVTFNVFPGKRKGKIVCRLGAPERPSDIKIIPFVPEDSKILQVNSLHEELSIEHANEDHSADMLTQHEKEKPVTGEITQLDESATPVNEETKASHVGEILPDTDSEESSSEELLETELGENEDFSEEDSIVDENDDVDENDLFVDDFENDEEGFDDFDEPSI